eukprot:gene1314-763_t
MSCGDAKLNHPAPAFDEMALMPNGTFKKVSLASYKGKWVVLFFYPMDFTFVCPTEICQFSDNVKEFNSINCEVIACSMDSEYSHLAWTMQDRKKGGLGKMEIPIIADKTKSIIRSYGCLKEDDGVAYRGVFIIDPRGNLRQFTVNDLPVGRSVEEVLRLVKAFQFVEVHGEVCPANWKPGAATMKPDPKASVDGFFSKLFIFYSILSLAKKRGSELFSISAAFIRFLIYPRPAPRPLFTLQGGLAPHGRTRRMKACLLIQYHMKREKQKKRAFKKARICSERMKRSLSVSFSSTPRCKRPSNCLLAFTFILCFPLFLAGSFVAPDSPTTTTDCPIPSFRTQPPRPAFDEMALMPNGTFKKVSLASYKGKWVVLFFYPMDFTFVCPTEICQFSDNVKEFNSINCEVIACSMDSEYSHLAWTMQDRKKGGLGKMEIPIIADKTKSIIRSYGCLKEDDGVAYRGVFIIDPRGNLRQFTVNDLPVGRSVEEVLRLVKAFQFVEVHGEVCPANWKPGAATMKPDPKASVDGFFSKTLVFFVSFVVVKKDIIEVNQEYKSAHYFASLSSDLSSNGNSDVWRRVLTFCDAPTIAVARCVAREINNILLEELERNIGWRRIKISTSKGCLSPTSRVLVSGLECRDGCVDCSSQWLEQSLSRCADAVAGARIKGFKAVERRIATIVASKQTSSAEVELNFGQNAATENEEKVLEAAYQQHANEWLGYINDLRRAQHNIRHGLFNSYSLSTTAFAFFLPDGTLVAAEGEQVLFLSRQKDCFDGMFRFNDGRDGEHSRHGEALRSRWILEKAYQLDSLVISARYEPYSKSIDVATEDGIVRLKVFTPRMRAMRARLEGQPLDSPMPYVIDSSYDWGLQGVETVDSMALPSYAWTPRGLYFAMEAIGSSETSVRKAQVGRERGEQHAAPKLRVPADDDSICVIYDDVDVTSSVVASNGCKKFCRATLNTLYTVVGNEINASLSEEAPANPNGTSNHSGAARDIHEEGCATSPFDTTIDTSFPLDTPRAEEVEISKAFVFTSMPRTTLVLMAGSNGMVGLESRNACAEVEMVCGASEDARLLSVSRFKKLPPGSVARVPTCEKKVELLSGKQQRISLPAVQWDLDQSTSGDVEECEVLVATLDAGVKIARIKLRRCLVSKIGKHVENTFTTGGDGQLMVHVTQTWYFLKGFYYFWAPNSAETLRTISSPTSMLVAPRPWLPELQDQLHRGVSEELLLRCGSNGVQWCPKLDGHPYFPKPFVLQCRDGLTIWCSESEGRGEKGTVLALGEAITKPNIPIRTRIHSRRYATLMGSARCCAISPISAFFVFATRRGDIVMAAPLLSAAPPSTSVNPTSDKGGNCLSCSSASSSTSEAESEASSSSASDPQPARPTGFSDSRGWKLCERHYRCTESSLTPEDLDVEMNDEPGVERHSTKGPVSCDAVFGSLFRRDPVLRYIQNRFPSLTTLWEQQITRKEWDGADLQTNTEVISCLRLPLYVCYLKMDPVDKQYMPAIVSMAVDGWKLTTLNKAFDAVIYEMTGLQPSSAHDTSGCLYPRMTPLFSVGLFSRPLDYLHCSKFQLALLELLGKGRRMDGMRWHDGVLLLQTGLEDSTNAFLLDFSPVFHPPEFVKRELKSSPLGIDLLKSEHGPSAHSMRCPGARQMRTWTSDYGRAIESGKQYWKRVAHNRIAGVAAGLTDAESEDDGAAIAALDYFLEEHYHLLDLLAHWLPGEPAFSYPEFHKSLTDGAMRYRMLSHYDHALPPHFHVMNTQHWTKQWLTVLFMVSYFLIIPYIALNAANLSETSTVMPYWGTLFFVLPLCAALICVGWYTVPSYEPFHKRLVLGCSMDGILGIIMTVLFALKHDGVIPDTVRWWEISMIPAASLVLYIMTFVWNVRQPHKKNVVKEALLYPPFYVIPFVVLCSLYFDYSSPSHPEEGLFPLAVAFIPLFAFCAVLAFFEVRDSLLSHEGVLLRFVCGLRIFILLFCLVFPLLIFVVNYSRYWKWVADPLGTKKPSCIAPAVITCSTPSLRSPPFTADTPLAAVPSWLGFEASNKCGGEQANSEPDKIFVIFVEDKVAMTPYTDSSTITDQHLLHLKKKKRSTPARNEPKALRPAETRKFEDYDAVGFWVSCTSNKDLTHTGRRLLACKHRRSVLHGGYKPVAVILLPALLNSAAAVNICTAETST